MQSATKRNATNAAIHMRLRDATAGQHSFLDEGLRYLLNAELSTDRYTRLLAALLGFYAPLEDSVAQVQAATQRIALPLIRRAGLLERDLHALGWAPAQVPRCGEMPTLSTANHAAGAIYVVEGACLGGQVIARAVRRRFGFGQENGAAFFSGDGVQTGARWRQVLLWLEERESDRGGDEEDEIVAGACRTFAALSTWLSARQVLDE